MAQKNPIAEAALNYFTALYEVEQETTDLSIDVRYRLRQTKAKPIAGALHGWLITNRQKVSCWWQQSQSNGMRSCVSSTQVTYQTITTG
jgi:Transposase IS66 family